MSAHRHTAGGSCAIVHSPCCSALIACCLYLLCTVPHASGMGTVTVQARLADADIYLGEGTSLELRINGIRNPEPPDLTHPDIDITKAGGQSFNNSSYTMSNGQIRNVESLSADTLEITLASDDSAWLNQRLQQEGFKVSAITPKQKTLKEFFLAITGD